MSTTSRVLLLLTAAAAVGSLLSGCVGSSSSGGSEFSASATTESAAGNASAGAGGSAAASSAAQVDACGLLDAPQVVSLIGYASSGQPTTGNSEAYGLAACTWGTADRGLFSSLQVVTPGAVTDPLALLLGGAGQTPQPVSGLPNGQSWAVGLMPGGGGVGYTVTWTEPNGEQVALSLLGEDIPDANKQSVTTVAEQVASQLGG